MNERIQELAKQAGAVKVWEWASDDVLDTKNMDLEKFAELIVRDCLYIVYERKDQAIEMGWLVDEAMSCAAMHIAENFGVEE